jgi:hypothetical protein
LTDRSLSRILGCFGGFSGSIGGFLGINQAFADEVQLPQEKTCLDSADNDQSECEYVNRIVKRPVPKTWRLCSHLFHFLGSKVVEQKRQRQMPQRLEPCRKSSPFDIQSASFDRGAEYVRIYTIVIPELKFSDVQMQILFADLVKGSDYAALQNRPEAFDGLCMDGADDVLPSTMVNGAMRIALVGQPAASGPRIGAKQANLVGKPLRERRRSVRHPEHWQ